MMLELILGGARSGKSRYAEQRCVDSNLEKYYIATAQALDAEMTARIQKHKQRRDSSWQTIEEAYALADTLKEQARPERCILIDCLTLWISNFLANDATEQWQQEKAKLLSSISQLPGHIIIVSNEVGSGIIPMGELSRCYVDEAGCLHQALGKLSDRVVLLVAGLPQILKQQQAL